MTLEALKNAIARLIVARREAHGNEAEQARQIVQFKIYPT